VSVVSAPDASPIHDLLALTTQLRIAHAPLIIMPTTGATKRLSGLIGIKRCHVTRYAIDALQLIPARRNDTLRRPLSIRF